MSAILDQSYSKSDFTVDVLPAKEFENCLFNGCNFQSTDLSGVAFIECTFTDCNLSNVKLQKTAFKDCRFRNCKMIGMHFEHCNDFLFEVNFDSCQLDHCSFYKRKMKKASFVKCSLKESMFAEADLSEANFSGADLSMSSFDQTNLEKADFRGAMNYSIDPENNKIKKAKFSADGIAGLLDKYQISISH